MAPKKVVQTTFVRRVVRDVMPCRDGRRVFCATASLPLTLSFDRTASRRALRKDRVVHPDRSPQQSRAERRLRLAEDVRFLGWSVLAPHHLEPLELRSGFVPAEERSLAAGHEHDRREESRRRHDTPNRAGRPSSGDGSSADLRACG
jgi:hypothetical protein